MDEVASNVSDRKRPKAPWPWGLVAGILLAVFILTSIAGLLVAIFGKKIIHPTISFYFQVVAGFFAFFLSISETGLLVSTVKWVESVKQEQVKLLRSSVLSASGRLRSIPNTIPEQPVRDFNAARILLVYISITGLNLGLLLGLLSLNLMFVYESHTSLRGELWPFFTVDVTLGLIVPLIIGVSLIPLGVK
ncbi:PREDICTED: uncharacterized protein LOC109585161 [Amphimedon queenslandica]|uniref:Uncharacterized protein n=2 Tax=Amphimedon queenslandica TaxID=400682 RepID=A0AAN0JIT1_AMPQE|nr:PREDICTED: uncharacterized protein LOC109585161 [Amphimedon queenslandica]|eukprot:XP_019856706.1 PREDICTED: uncharacterized protein LOC109585161 [Amphimedon queenslandica]